MQERTLYAGGILVAGVVLVALQLFQGIQQLSGFEGTDLGIVFTFETVPFVVVALALTFVGYWLYARSEIDTGMGRVVAWTVGSVILFVSVAALLTFSLQVTLAGDTITQAPYIVVNLVTVGALAGALVGIYDARSQSRTRELERERDRVEQFAKKAADINNYGRELNRCESVEEVSSLCLQAMQTFLGLTNLAFIITEGDEAELVDDTTVGVPAETLATLARNSRDQQQATVVTHTLSEEAGRVGNAFTLLVTDHDGHSMVLVALTDDPNAVGDEDIQLLEMLVAHAATSLDRIHDFTVKADGSRL